MNDESTLRAFVFRDPRECFVQSDVAEALGLPSYIRQASLTVFSRNARDAWRRLRELELVHQKSHRLIEAYDVRSHALSAMSYQVNEGTVFMYPSAGGRVPVVEVKLGDAGRVVTRIGFIRPRFDVEGSSLIQTYVYEPVDGVTDMMLNAAFEMLPRHAPPTLDDVRRAINAALDIQRDEFGIAP